MGLATFNNHTWLVRIGQHRPDSWALVGLWVWPGERLGRRTLVLCPSPAGSACHGSGVQRAAHSLTKRAAPLVVRACSCHSAGLVTRPLDLVGCSVLILDDMFDFFFLFSEKAKLRLSIGIVWIAFPQGYFLPSWCLAVLKHLSVPA